MPQPTAQTTAQLFQQNGLPQWWNHPTQRFGQNDPVGGIEQGTDFALPYGTKVGSISAGTVTYVGKGGYNDPSLGTIVQIQGANGSIFHYQHLASSGLKVGQRVDPGSLIGISGGSKGRFSTGPHIEVRYASIYSFNSGVWSQHWIDPLQTIMGLTGGKPFGAVTGAKPYGTGAGPTSNTTIANQATSTLTTPTSAAPFGAGASFTMPTIGIGPNDDVTTVLWTIDELMQLIPPWNVINAHDVTILGADTGLVDPISWAEGFMFNLGLDMIALFLRFILLAWGIALGLKIMNTFVDLSAVQQSAAALGQLAIGAMAA